MLRLDLKTVVKTSEKLKARNPLRHTSSEKDLKVNAGLVVNCNSENPKDKYKIFKKLITFLYIYCIIYNFYYFYLALFVNNIYNQTNLINNCKIEARYLSVLLRS